MISSFIAYFIIERFSGSFVFQGGRYDGRESRPPRDRYDDRDRDRDHYRGGGYDGPPNRGGGGYGPVGPRYGGDPYGPPGRGGHAPPPPRRGGPDDRRRDEGAPGTSLLVRNIGPSITERDLGQAFSRIGRLTDVYIPKDYYSQQTKGFAFIEYATPEFAREAREEMNRFRLKGHELEVVFAQERRKSAKEMRNRGQDQRGGTDGGGGGGSGNGGGGGKGRRRRRGGAGFERSSSFERHKQRERDQHRQSEGKGPESSGGKSGGASDNREAK